jgi:YidC/Oxa1 family membrane protein insertase
MNIFEVFLTTPILNLLIAFYKLFATLSIPGALGFAIILMTVVIRLALWPLTSTQLRSSQKMAALKPHLDRIKAEHGHDKVRHQQEVTKLYKEHGVNPLAGCLPLLLQIPVFIALYNVLLKVVQVNGDFLVNINQRLYFPFLYLDKLPNTSFLGFNLSSKPNQWHEIGFVILLIPIVTGLLQFIQSKMLTPSVAKTEIVKKNSPTGKEKEGLEDAMTSMQSQMSLIMPLMIAFFSYGFPVGLSLYWNTFTVIGIIQQYVISGPGALAKYLPAKLQK